MSTKRSTILISSTLRINDGVVPAVEFTIPQLKTGKAGIYQLINTRNGHYYIGQSRNLQNRRTRHLNDLRSFAHKNPLLQEEFLFFGESCFEFRVVMFCRESELTFYENALIKALNPFFNIKSVLQK